MHRRPPRTAALAAGLLAALLTAGGCASPSPSAPAPPPAIDGPSASDPEPGAVRMAAVGDSITDADSADLAAGDAGPQSWVSHALGPDVEFVGGWARWGARTEEMAEAVEAPFDADVLVVLAGTNDAGREPHETIGRNILAIVERAGVETVVLSSVPPNDFAGEVMTDLNASLEQLAAQQGWVWVDAGAAVRDGDRFADGMSYDGTHPTEAGARLIGEAIGEAVRQATRG